MQNMSFGDKGRCYVPRGILFSSELSNEMTEAVKAWFIALIPIHLLISAAVSFVSTCRCCLVTLNLLFALN